MCTRQIKRRLNLVLYQKSLAAFSKYCFNTVELWHNKGPRDWKTLFAKMMFRYVQVFFYIFYYYWGKENRLSYLGTIWKFVESRFHCNYSCRWKCTTQSSKLDSCMSKDKQLEFQDRSLIKQSFTFLFQKCRMSSTFRQLYNWLFPC